MKWFASITLKGATESNRLTSMNKPREESQFNLIQLKLNHEETSLIHTTTIKISMSRTIVSRDACCDHDHQIYVNMASILMSEEHIYLESGQKFKAVITTDIQEASHASQK